MGKKNDEMYSSSSSSARQMQQNPWHECYTIILHVEAEESRMKWIKLTLIRARRRWFNRGSILIARPPFGSKLHVSQRRSSVRRWTNRKIHWQSYLFHPLMPFDRLDSVSFTRELF